MTKNKPELEPTQAGNGLASELERLRGDSDDSHLVAMRKMRARGHFIDQHFDAILAALSTPLADNGLAEALEAFVGALTDNGRNRPGQLSVDSDALRAIIARAKLALSRTPSQANDAAGQGEVERLREAVNVAKRELANLCSDPADLDLALQRINRAALNTSQGEGK